MATPDEHKKQEAIKALIRIAVLEGVLLVAVVGVYLKTNDLTYLIGGMVGVFLISGPMFVRWFNDHKNALENKADQNSPHTH